MSLPSDADSACGIAIMAKASRPGFAKTRLSPPLTPDEAALCNTAFLQDIAANVLRAAREESIAGYVAYGPEGAADFFRRHLPAEMHLVETVDRDFGVCLTKALAAQFARGRSAACVLNSDSPTLPSAFLAETARVLTAPGERIVLGPSTDGGYYILGCKRVHGRLFEDIAWSTPSVLEQTLERAAELALPVHRLPIWYDVDDADSLRLAAAELLEGRPFNAAIASSPAPATTRLLQRLAAQGRLDGVEVRHPAQAAPSRQPHPFPAP